MSKSDLEKWSDIIAENGKRASQQTLPPERGSGSVHQQRVEAITCPIAPFHARRQGPQDYQIFDATGKLFARCFSQDSANYICAWLNKPEEGQANV